MSSPLIKSAIALLRRIFRSNSQAVEPITMISPEEADYFTQLVRGLKGRRGEIVDLGCWLGGTSCALARGLCAAQSELEKVHAFDLFVWEDWMNGRGVSLEAGDDFLPLAQQNAGPYAPLINFIKADLCRYAWGGGEIKLLLVDAMKSFGLATAIAERFYPHLKPGSILIHQDYSHYYTPWIQLLQYRLRGHFRILTTTPVNSTIAYEMITEVSLPEAQQAADFNAVTDQEIDDAFEFSLGQLDDARLTPVLASHVMCFVHLERPVKAFETYHKYLEDMDKESVDFKSMKAALERLAPGKLAGEDPGRIQTPEM